MKLRFAHVSDAPKARSKQLLAIPFALALVVIVMLLSQLFHFEDFVSFFVSNGSVDAYDKTKASFLVLAELFALPFWLQMRLSSLARGASAFLGLVFPLQWLLIAAMAHIGAVPYFGSLVTFSNDMDLLWGVLLVLASLISFYILRGTSLFKRK